MRTIRIYTRMGVRKRVERVFGCMGPAVCRARVCEGVRAWLIASVLCLSWGQEAARYNWEIAPCLSGCFSHCKRSHMFFGIV